MKTALDRLGDSLRPRSTVERRGRREVPPDVGARASGLDPVQLLEVTVTQTATVLCGEDTIYRYDLPLSGVTNGWAIPAIIEQARQLYPESWPAIEVIVDAPEDETEALVRAFIAKGAAAYPSEVVREEDLPAPDGDHDRDDSAAAGLGESVWRDRFRINGFRLLLGCVVAVVAGVSWWVISATTQQDLPEARGAGSGVKGVAMADDAEEEVDDHPAEDAEGGETAVPEHEPAVGRVVVHELGTARLSTPLGFHVTAEEGQWLVVGPDQDLRVRVIMDPTNGVDAGRILAALDRGISEDPQLEPLEAHQAGEVAYLESPGDGSQTRWVSWVDGLHHVSVGCQTRQQAIPTQLAACDLVRESLEITGG